MKIPSKNIINSLQKNQSNTWYSYREHNLKKKKKKNQTLLSIYGHVSNRVWGWKLTRYERNLERIRHTQPDVRQSHSSSHTFECLASTCGQSGAHEGETSLYTQLRAYAACAIRGEPTREHSVGIRVYICIWCVRIHIYSTYIYTWVRSSFEMKSESTERRGWVQRSHWGIRGNDIAGHWPEKDSAFLARLRYSRRSRWSARLIAALVLINLSNKQG